MFSDVIEFIRTLYPNDKSIPLHAPSFIGNEKKYVLDAIDSTFVSSVGTYVDQFESAFAQYVGADYAVAVVNGTAALHVSLLLCDVEQNDLVITQPLTFVATGNAIKYCGADPIFLDIDPNTLSLCPHALTNFLEKDTEVINNHCIHKVSGRKIKACLPMHTFGHPAKIKQIVSICETHHISVVEDAAESLGSYYHNQHTGTFGKVGVFSFNGNKIMTTGGGGMIVTNDVEIAKKAKHLTTTAKLPHQWAYIHDTVGYNYRLPNLNAALGLAQLEQLDAFLAAKRSLAQQYKDYFKDQKKCRYLSEPEDARSNFWLNTLLFEHKKDRDHFLHDLNHANIMVRPVWEPLCYLKPFVGCMTDNLTQLQSIYERLANIPSSYIHEPKS